MKELIEAIVIETKYRSFVNQFPWIHDWHNGRRIWLTAYLQVKENT